MTDLPAPGNAILNSAQALAEALFAGKMQSLEFVPRGVMNHKKELVALLATDGMTNSLALTQSYTCAISKLAYDSNGSGWDMLYNLLMIGGLSSTLGAISLLKKASGEGAGPTASVIWREIM